jgi:hypothetical protein
MGGRAPCWLGRREPTRPEGFGAVSRCRACAVVATTRTSRAWLALPVPSSWPRARPSLGSSFCSVVSTLGSGWRGASSHTICHRAGLGRLARDGHGQHRQQQHTNDALHLRKLARLLLDTHDCGAVLVRVGAGGAGDAGDVTSPASTLFQWRSALRNALGGLGGSSVRAADLTP